MYGFSNNEFKQKKSRIIHKDGNFFRCNAGESI